jgi:hypothetical protein
VRVCALSGSTAAILAIPEKTQRTIEDMRISPRVRADGNAHPSPVGASAALSTRRIATRLPLAADRRIRLPLAVARHRLLLLGMLGLACAVAAWLRIPPVARDTLWAEDGRTFLQDAVNRGPLLSLVQPYAGYLHTIPRLIASLTVSVVPVGLWAQAMTAGACLVAGLLAAVVFVCSRDVLPWFPARLLLATVTVLAPLAPREVLGNVANLHSLVLWAVFWMLLYRPRSQRAAIALGIVGLLGAATEIQCVFLLPLLFLTRPHDGRRRIVAIGVLAGVAAQLFVTVMWPRAHSGNPPVGVPSILYGYLINAATPVVVPQSSIGPLLAASGPAVGVGVVTVAVAATAYVVIRGRRLQRVAALALLVGSLGLYTAAVVDNPNTFYDYATFDRRQLLSVWLTRYGVVPSMMLLAVMLLAVGVAVSRARRGGDEEPRRSRRILMAGRVACVALALLLLVQFVPQGTRRSSGPQWSPQVVAAQRFCLSEEPEKLVVLRETIGWHVVLSCRVLG